MKNYTCHHCHKKGHLARVGCLRKSQGRNQQQAPRTSYRSHGRTYQVKVEDESPQDLESASLFKVGVSGIQPIQVEITLDDKPTVMEVNTGASVSLVSEAQFFDLFPNASLLSSRIQLKTYTSESVAVVGKITLQVKYQSQVKSLLLVVVKGSGPALLGRNWLQEIRLNWHQIVYTVTGSDNKGLQDVLSKYPSVFELVWTLTQYPKPICL